MASSNRNWPSMFKSKPNHHQWQHDVNDPSSLLSSGPFQKNTSIYSSAPGSGCEERSPEPKPRWNPKPEQIRILEAIFNSGMVNPPRDEIRKIRAQLQEYGQVGDANVFYWFQNRKSRSKHKQRHLHSARSSQARSSAVAGPTNSSSSSSSGSPDKFVTASTPSVGPTGLKVETTAAAAATALLTSEFLVEAPFSSAGHGFGFAPFPDQLGISVGPAMWGELVLGQEGNKNGFGLLLEENKMDDDVGRNNKIQNPNPNPNPNAVGGLCVAAADSVTVGVQGPFSEIQGTPGLVIGGAASRSMVFINEVAFEVVSGPLNIREAFGEEAILIHSSGHPVLTDQWGLTLHPLQHGASYYLV